LGAGFLSLENTLDAIYFETLALIFGMSLVSAILARSGLFAMIAHRAAAGAVGNGWWILVLFSLLTYSLSLVVNNLAAIVVIAPVTLTLCRQMKLDPIPILIAEIIASNLGGASTMIGDFPNMIILSAAHLQFVDFISGMMVPCLMLLAVMLGYFQWRRGEIMLDLATAAQGQTDASGGSTPVFEDPVVDPRLLKWGLGILAVMLIAFVLFETLQLRPGWIALLGGLVALAVDARYKDDWFADCGGPDILFFAGLFVMVGGLVAAGVLDGFVWLIDTVSGGCDVPRLLALMWIAAISTIFLNAGPSTAFFIPVANGMYQSLADPRVWWALSLGVLAGSSAALSGATAGVVTVSRLDRYVADHPEMKDFMSRPTLDFRTYLNWGLPIMGIFLAISTLYITSVSL